MYSIERIVMSNWRILQIRIADLHMRLEASSQRADSSWQQGSTHEAQGTVFCYFSLVARTKSHWVPGSLRLLSIDPCAWLD